MSLQLGAQTLGGLKLAAELIELPTLVAAAVQTALTGASDAKPPGLSTTMRLQTTAACAAAQFSSSGAAACHHPCTLFTFVFSLLCARVPVTVAAKSAFAALLTLLFEAARSDASPADVTSATTR